eukprot:10640244-Heterocapsa_arctica.AAC.1
MILARCPGREVLVLVAASIVQRPKVSADVVEDGPAEVHVATEGWQSASSRVGFGQFVPNWH